MIATHPQKFTSFLSFTPFLRKEPLQNVSKIVSSRQKSVTQAKRSERAYFEPIFNTEMTTQIVSRGFRNLFSDNFDQWD